ncbi:MAG: hypothetical protein QOG87_1549 [Actinomycetota bacterium]|jgi:hypothetical protein
MSSERLVRILGRLNGEEAVPSMLRLCEMGAELSGTTGAGIMLMVDGVQQGTLCVSDDTSAVIEELQNTLGEGPCIDAYHGGRPVLEPDLVNPMADRWAAFTPAAVAAGARAIFGFPLLIGATRLGAFNFYRNAKGPLTDDQHADLSVMADVAARAVIDLQAQARGGALAEELRAGTDYQLVVHQASGMVSVQLGIGVADALVRLRAHAFANDERLTDVAAAVVAKRLRFGEPDGG